MSLAKYFLLIALFTCAASTHCMLTKRTVESEITCNEIKKSKLETNLDLIRQKGFRWFLLRTELPAEAVDRIMHYAIPKIPHDTIANLLSCINIPQPHWEYITENMFAPHQPITATIQGKNYEGELSPNKKIAALLVRNTDLFSRAKLLVYDTSSFTRLYKKKFGEFYSIYEARFSPDNSFLAILSSGAINVFYIPTHQRICKLKTMVPCSIEFNHDGTLLYGIVDEQHTITFDLSSFYKIRTFCKQPTLEHAQFLTQHNPTRLELQSYLKQHIAQRNYVATQITKYFDQKMYQATTFLYIVKHLILYCFNRARGHEE